MTNEVSPSQTPAEMACKHGLDHVACKKCFAERHSSAPSPSASEMQKLLQELEHALEDEIPFVQAAAPLEVADAAVGKTLRENNILPKVLAYTRSLESQNATLKSDHAKMKEGLKGIADFKGNMHVCRECHGESGEYQAEKANSVLSTLKP